MTEADGWILFFGGLIGVAAGVAASIVYDLAVRRLRPNLVISAHIARDGAIHRVKIVNRSQRDAVDVAVHVYVEQSTQMPDGGTNQTRVRVGTRFSLEVIPGQTRSAKRDPRSRYARLVRLDSDFRSTWEDRGIHYPILFVVIAKDAVSGVTKIFEQRFGRPAVCIRDGVFKTGNSLEIASLNE